MSQSQPTSFKEIIEKLLTAKDAKYAKKPKISEEAVSKSRRHKVIRTKNRRELPKAIAGYSSKP